MAIESKKKTINGVEYQVTQFGGMTGIRFAVRIFKLVGPGLASVLNGNVKISELMDSDTSELNLAGMVTGLLERMDEKGTPELILSLLSSTHRDMKELDEGTFNQAFAGNYGELIPALMCVLEVNYGSFFGALTAGNIGFPAAPVKE